MTDREVLNKIALEFTGLLLEEISEEEKKVVRILNEADIISILKMKDAEMIVMKEKSSPNNGESILEL